MHDSTGLYPLILHKFCQVLGVSIARANAQLRLQRLHYICPNKRAAALAAKRNARGNTWKATGFSLFAEQERY
eukprot:6029224-Ditylum_brightwellii.AAC.1